MEGILFMGGVIVGVVIATIVFYKLRGVGTLYFYQIEPDKPPVMTAELNDSPGNISSHRHVVFKISHK